jgi:hypothetical protein
MSPPLPALLHAYTPTRLHAYTSTRPHAYTRSSLLAILGQEFDGSDSGARPDEAISWGKIRVDCKPVKVFAEASIVFPLIVAQTFAREGPRA